LTNNRPPGISPRCRPVLHTVEQGRTVVWTDGVTGRVSFPCAICQTQHYIDF